MFDQSVLTELRKLTGWRQNPDATGIQLNATAIETTSGMYYNDEHPNLTIENLIALARDVRTIAGDDDAQFSAWLNEKTDASIMRALSSWERMKLKTSTGKNLMERSELFRGATRVEDVDTNTQGFSGLSIQPRLSNSIRYQIMQVGLRLEDSQDVTVSLFSTEGSTPIRTETFTYSSAGDQMWFTPTESWILEGRGMYFIGYDQGAITGRSVNTASDHRYGRSGFRQLPGGRYFFAQAFHVGENGATMWDVSDTVYTTDTNYGMNLRMKAYCDYSAFVTEQASVFADMIRKQVAVDFLMELVSNPQARANRNVRRIDYNGLRYDIDGDSQGRKAGLRKELENAIKCAVLDTSGIDKECQDCYKKGLKVKAFHE